MCASTPQFLSTQHALAAAKVTRIRATETDSVTFRQLLHELTLMLVTAATADLPLQPCTVQTPLSTAEGSQLMDNITLVPILRAGLGMVSGASLLLPQASIWHIGIKRNEQTKLPHAYYANRPESHHASLALVLDPMLATGGSVVVACDMLKSWGVTRIKFIGIIAAPPGVARLQAAHPDVEMYIAQLDPALDDRAYITPGLGDAGDRQFGTL